MVEVSTLTYNLGNFGFWMCSTGWFKQNCFRSHCSPIVGGSTPNGKNHLKFPFWLFDNPPKGEGGGSSIHSIITFGGGVQNYLLNEQSPFSEQITIDWPCTATTAKYWKRWSFPICKIVLDHKASLNPIQLNFKCHLQKLNLFNITFLTQGFPKMYSHQEGKASEKHLIRLRRRVKNVNLPGIWSG